ncbi:MAG: hypothetical protein K0S65_6104 [Labilithrix sp.]|nr:hypothetical protein [Labilithrix sp.]
MVVAPAETSTTSRNLEEPRVVGAPVDGVGRRVDDALRLHAVHEERGLGRLRPLRDRAHRAGVERDEDVRRPSRVQRDAHGRRLAAGGERRERGAERDDGLRAGRDEALLGVRDAVPEEDGVERSPERAVAGARVLPVGAAHPLGVDDVAASNEAGDADVGEKEIGAQASGPSVVRRSCIYPQIRISAAVESPPLPEASRSSSSTTMPCHAHVEVSAELGGPTSLDIAQGLALLGIRAPTSAIRPAFEGSEGEHGRDVIVLADTFGGYVAPSSTRRPAPTA